MLVKLTIETNEKRPLNVGNMLLNTDYITDAKTVEATKTQFLFTANQRDRRESSALMKSTEAISVIKTAFGATWNTNYLDLPIFEDNISTKSTETRTFAIQDLAWFTEDRNSATTRSWAYILEGGFKIRKYLIDYNLDQILDLADTGGTTTTV